MVFLCFFTFLVPFLSVDNPLATHNSSIFPDEVLTFGTTALETTVAIYAINSDDKNKLSGHRSRDIICQEHSFSSNYLQLNLTNKITNIRP